MLVISINYLIGIVVALYYASVASASPTGVINTSNTTALVHRTPEGHLCLQNVWLSRQCAPDRSAMAWDDYCMNAGFQFSVPGLCPDNTVCDGLLAFEQSSGQMIQTVQCLALNRPGTALPRKRAMDPQIGTSSTKRAGSTFAPTQMHHELFIADDMLASVFATVLAEDTRYVADPVNIIVGKLRGKEVTVCKGDTGIAWRYKTCNPTGRFNMKFGDAIDFTWALGKGTAGSLSYAVFPS